VSLFLNDLDVEPASKKEIAIVILLIFPAFGPSSGSESKKSLDTTT
jgi:hypothetical protein